MIFLFVGIKKAPIKCLTLWGQFINQKWYAK